MMFELYLDVLREAFVSHFVLSYGEEVTAIAMKAFGGFDLSLAAFMGAFGCALSCVVNYRLGVLLREVPVLKTRRIPLPEWALWFCLLAAYPFGNLVMLIGGYQRWHWQRALLLVAISVTLRYTLMVYV